MHTDRGCAQYALTSDCRESLNIAGFFNAPQDQGHATGRIVLASAALLILGYFIGRSIWTQWDAIRAYPWQLHPGWLLLSALSVWLTFLIFIILWRVQLVLISGKGLGFGSAYRIWVLSNLGKYLPGKLWAVMGMVFLLQREGYAAPSALAAAILHQAFAVVAGAVFAGAVLGTELWRSLPLVPLALGLGLSLILLYPPFFSRLLNWGLRLIGREPVAFRLPFAKALMLFVAYVFAWMVYGASLWCMMWGLGAAPVWFWEIAASFVAAYLIGFLALFTPGGLGVREGVLAMLLVPHLPTGLAALVAVAARLWMTIVELLGLVPLAGRIGKSMPAAPRSNPAENDDPH